VFPETCYGLLALSVYESGVSLAGCRDSDVRFLDLGSLDVTQMLTQMAAVV
jgi:hypothetical protein